ncbi:zinc-binding dehydrogenase [Paracoccus fistulariae]|uniref:Zinc-binding dehydrogenase n=1 Tax=Paracoccus fistulariae TaxID=658446 RepID=A0ABY7SM88_9RHOB|nr:zinc-binding dehydrogenase [Paracoccus fistulariae]MDB6180025.1 zinc-binding dehydrogenase [Paracoccus fistulariae]WCR08114.1 zinc-binding dehydrogenase [Paracoccus fistulariae]
MTSIVRKGRAVVLEGPNALKLHDLSVSRPEPDAVLARVEFGGVCGSDVHMTRGEFPLPHAIVLGHEGVGVIEELGSNVVADYAGVPVSPGDRIYWCPIAPCHHCWYCTVEKDFSSCTNATWFGPIEKPTWGSYADYVTLPSDAAFFRIPDDTPSEAVIAFGCALPAVLQGLERAGGVKPLQSVVVQGCGPIGLSAILIARLSGAQSIIAIDGSGLRLDFARRFGATATLDISQTTPQERRQAVRELTANRGADMVIEGTGHHTAFGEGLGLCARNGTYLLIGLWASQGEQPFDPSFVVQNNLRIVGTQYAQAHHYHDAMRIAALHHATFPFAELITHRCMLDEAQHALDLVSSGAAGKVVMCPC